MNALPPLFFITGPTGSGKTEIAARVAAQCNAEIIGADAFQIYQGMNILTAKPPPAIRAAVPHHLVDCIPLSKSFDVGQYLELAGRCAREIAARGRLPIVVGGTGLYIRALTHGLSALPGADAAIRAALEAMSLDALQARYTRLDPEGAGRIDLKNRRRLIRAIEVCELSGKPFSSFRGLWKTRPETASGVLLIRERDDLCSRINRRVEAMMRSGLLEEVRELPEPGTTACMAIGLREARACLKGEITPAECMEKIRLSTRRYAKRQMTWFRRESAFEIIHLSESAGLESAIRLIAEKAAAFARRKKTEAGQTENAPPDPE